MSNNERNVIFLRCSQKEYNDLKASNQINNNVIYYITDGGVIYQGNHIYGTKFIDSEDASWSTITPNTFRHNKKTGEVRYYFNANDYVVINESKSSRDEDTQKLINDNLSWETIPEAHQK